MKITKRNTVPADRIWVGTCQNCKSEAEAEEKELKNISNDSMHGVPWSWEVCPVCGAGPYSGMLFYPKRG